ncbi:phosphodiesterase [Wenjunlia tyrosinilytica]|uniref:3',5'-cyclic adenosine monophosphate phosphodiesterase CpdA n=1 Tax=Wenjunlia tyrosinilytica TaxID=1544741 RepID=A0A918E2S8_9ACTN|nr:phosphodiesterase [Wenjunlia tyrosinilytica]GGP00960.1 3',5'-cyclic adenosine monophosphate phosphodiesterase CpdA [Wenjunlia tyrosinilytica]
MIVLAHISDPHFDGGPRSTERAQRVMDYLNGLSGQVDAVLVTGDIADHALPAEYEEARKVLASPLPMMVCPGNHDAREPFREAFAQEEGGDAPVNEVHRVAGAVFAVCDSSIPGQDDGHLSDETLEWLEGVLAGTSPETPVFVCFHHPPVELHVPHIDGVRQFGQERLAAVAARHPQIVAFLAGHAHTPAATVFAGRPLLVAPGVTSTVNLPWEMGEGDGPVNHDAPPAVAFHILGDDRRLTTHYRFIP